MSASGPSGPLVFHRHNVTFPKISCLFKIYLKQLNTATLVKLDNMILGVITQSFICMYRLSPDMCLIFQEYPYFCQFYYRNDREQNWTFTEMSEAL